MLRCASIECMRTTLDIAEDVLLAVKERARRERRSAGEILSECAREGLLIGTGTRSPNRRAFLWSSTLALLAVSNELIDKLREEDGELRQRFSTSTCSSPCSMPAMSDHRKAREWISGEILHGWVLCPDREWIRLDHRNQPKYPSPVSPRPSTACDEQRVLSTTKFLPCSVSLLEGQHVNPVISTGRGR